MIQGSTRGHVVPRASMWTVPYCDMHIRLEKIQLEALGMAAAENRRSISEEVRIAVERHIATRLKARNAREKREARRGADRTVIDDDL